MKKYDVFGIGTALVDYFAKCTEDFLSKNNLIKGATNMVPRERLDELHSRLADSVFLQLPGDNARNTCEGVTYLGGKTAYASSVGEDPEGEFFEKSIAARGITPYVVRKPGRTGKIIALITRDGQRTFAVDLGNGSDLNSVPAEEIKNSNYLYLTSITLLASGSISGVARDAIETARQHGVKIALSLESPPMIAENRARLLRTVELADALFANSEELEALAGEPVGKNAKIVTDRVGLMFLKRDRNGSTVFSQGGKFLIPAYSQNPLDTTGAGDFYSAGVLFALGRGKSPEEAGHVGAKLAAKVVERFGATAYDPAP
ncbi:MAG: adenosine kinase [Candidatus Hadarchaeota archaeon]